MLAIAAVVDLGNNVKFYSSDSDHTLESLIVPGNLDSTVALSYTELHDSEQPVSLGATDVLTGPNFFMPGIYRDFEVIAGTDPTADPLMKLTPNDLTGTPTPWTLVGTTAIIPAT